MFDFGDELIINSYRIPWLIWIQLVVMLLLILLLYSLSSSPSDLSLLSSAAPATDPSTSFAANRPSLSLPTSSATTLLHSKQARGNQVEETATSTSKEGRRAGKEVIRKRDNVGSSTKDVGHGLIYGESYHPCNFLDLAKQAFLKCLGLDSSSDNPSRSKHGKDS